MATTATVPTAARMLESVTRTHQVLSAAGLTVRWLIARKEIPWKNLSQGLPLIKQVEEAGEAALNALANLARRRIPAESTHAVPEVMLRSGIARRRDGALELRDEFRELVVALVGGNGDDSFVYDINIIAEVVAFKGA